MWVRHLDSPTARHRLYWGLGLTLLVNGLLLAWLLLKPGRHAVVTAVDNVAQCIGPLLVLLLFLGDVVRGRRVPAPPARGVPAQSQAVPTAKYLRQAVLALWRCALGGTAHGQGWVTPFLPVALSQ